MRAESHWGAVRRTEPENREDKRCALMVISGYDRSSFHRFYLSADSTLDAGDMLAGSLTHATALASGESYAITHTLRMPSVVPGTYTLFLVTDADSRLPEVDETNNIRTIPLQLLAPDLRPVAFDAPASASLGQTIPLTWTVRNQGNGAALPVWYDRVYLSSDAAWSPDDTYLGSYASPSALAMGDVYTATPSLKLPSTLTVGTYTLIVLVDADDRLAESRSDNNTLTATLAVSGPDLALNGPSAFSAPDAGTLGQPIALGWGVHNQGDRDARPNWTDRVYLSTDNNWSVDDTYLGGLAQTYSVAPGGIYTSSLSVKPPTTIVTGTYYLFVRLDADDKLAEADEGNNTAMRTIVVGAPDLTISTFTAPPTGLLGQFLPVTWEVRNQGDRDALPAWTDRVYLSADASWDSGDTLLTNGSLAHSTALAAGAGYTGNLSVKLPSTIVTGTHYLILRADADGRLAESNEGNNTSAAVPIVVQAPNLVPTGLTPGSTSAKAGQYVSVSWTVQNQGDGSATPTWYDRLYFSTSSVWSSSATMVAARARGTAVDVGASYSVSLSGRIPTGVAPGTYYLILRTDSDSRLPESEELDNTRVVEVTITP